MKKIPFLTLEKAKEIREQIPTPFHVYDEVGIRANARALKAAFSWNPGFKEFFAVKATPNPFLLKILHEEGCGCDCATYTELLLSEAVGITGHDVVFSSNVTPELDMRKARDMGVYINLDDATYVDFLASMGPVPETVCLRYNPGGSFSLGNTIMDMPRDAKYGMTEADAYKLCQEHGLLSPIYAHCRRNGCWFCPNASDSELLHMVTKHPDMFDRLIEWENEDNIFHRRMTRRETPSEVKARLLSKSQTGFSSPKSK